MFIGLVSIGIAIPKDKIEDYRKISRKAGKIWKEHGALEYRECIGNDLDVPGMPGPSFPKRIRLKENETVVFSWVEWPDKATRDIGMKKMMEDPRMEAANPMPFDGKRMIFGGFAPVVDLKK